LTVRKKRIATRDGLVLGAADFLPQQKGYFTHSGWR
jgi:hypothetical protein